MTLKLRNPISWGRLQFSEVDEHRLDWCPFYEKCLYETAVAHWVGFSCTQCEIFIQEMELKAQGKDSLVGKFVNLIKERRENALVLSKTR